MLHRLIAGTPEHPVLVQSSGVLSVNPYRIARGAVRWHPAREG
jgi:hypothetical protein